MKIWNAYGSEHSMNLVMIGKFKDAGAAEAAKDAIEELQEYFREHEPDGQTYSEDVMALLSRLKVHTVGSAELDQFRYDFGISNAQERVIIKTDEADVSALWKVLIERGAKVEMFAPHAPFATTHVLMREYARRIIEVAESLNKGLLTSTEAKRACPPFPKDLHRVWPMGEVKGNARYCLPSSLDSDFLNYTIGRLVPKRSNYDFDHPEYRTVVAQILGRIRELGWSAESFGSADKNISSDSYRRHRNQPTSRRIDSYGEKFSWVAYHELTGMRLDLGLMEPSHRSDSDRSCEVDLDPSFPQPRREERLTAENWLDGAHKTLSAWIARGPVPDTTPLLRRKTIFNENGPWLMLDGHITQQDKVSGREIFCFVRALVVRKKDQSAVVRALKDQSIRGHWPLEKPSELYAYAGEFPWCSSFGVDYAATLRVVTERTMVTVMRRRPLMEDAATVEAIGRALELLKKGESPPPDLMASVALHLRTKLVPTQEVREKTTDFKVTIPVCEFLWEGPKIDDMSVSGCFLAKRIAQALKLRWMPGTHDVADSGGRRATCNTHFGAEFGNRQQAFFVREDLFKEYLRRTKQVLVWVSSGERQITHHWADHVRENRGEFGDPFKVFHTVKTLSPGRD